MRESKFMSRNAVRYSMAATALLSAVISVAAVLAYRTKEISFDPVAAADFSNDGKKDFLYIEPEEGSNNLYLLDGKFVREIGTKHLRSSKGKRIANGLVSRYGVNSSDVNEDGYHDIIIPNGGSRDILLGTQDGEFILAPRSVTVSGR